MKTLMASALFACYLMIPLRGLAIELTDVQQQALASPPPEVTLEIGRYLPRLLDWYARAEAELLPQGRPLNTAELAMAHTLVIRQPRKVRIVVQETFPLPDDPELLREAEASGMGSEDARTMGYVILLKPYLHEDPAVIAHELVHIAQHDRLGREVFLRRYLTELEVLGYETAPLEVEAYARQDALVAAHLRHATP